MRLPRDRTLKLRADFQAVREHGQSVSGRYFVLASLAKPGQARFRYGLITTKKVGAAHERNLIRRRLRAILILEGERISPEWDLVFIARWRAKEATMAQLHRDFFKLAEKLNLFETGQP